MIQISDEEFVLLKKFLSTACGIDVPSEKRYLFVTRLAELLDDIGCRGFSEFYRRLSSNGDAVLRARLVEAMTTNETAFFRDGHPFQTLASRVLPQVAARRRAESRFAPRLRVASVGCSTGEEPYSIAIAALEWLGSQRAFARTDVTVIAGDISKAALETAKRAWYPDKRLGGHLPARHRDAYFRKSGSGWIVKDEVRAMVLFNEMNLAEPLEQFGVFDVIFCRNVIIYFSLELKKRIVEQFHRMLQPGGVLVVGASENLYNISSRFRPQYEDQTIFYVKQEGVKG
jgi:chemotaxis protein methyltransferase CheR